MVSINLSGAQRDMRISSILLFQTILGSSRQLMFCAPSPPAITMLYLSDQISPFLVPQTISFLKLHLMNFLRANYYNLNQYLHTINWNVLFEYCFSVEDCWSEFRYQIELAFKAHVPRPLDLFIVPNPKRGILHSFTECCELNLNYGKPGSMSKTLGTGSDIIVLLKTVVTLSRNIMHPLNLIASEQKHR